MSAIKTSIRFFGDKEVRAVWDETDNKWWFCAVDIVSVLNEQDDYTKASNYWRWLKLKMIKEGNEFVSAAHRLKFTAADGKKYFTDALDSEGVVNLAKQFPNNRAMPFLDWFVYSDATIDGQSKKKAYDLFENGLLDSLDAGAVKCLRQIHGYIFGGIYDFAGQLRTINISKGGFTFVPCQYFDVTLSAIEKMPSTTFDEIADKYVEMNIAHPFLEGNGRSIRIWLDLMLKRALKKCVDWSKIDKYEYLNAMKASIANGTKIKALLRSALTDKIHDREMYMKGIDYSYYYEETTDTDLNGDSE